MESISCHIALLVVNSLGGRHIHTQTHTHTDIHTETILSNQAHHKPASTWFNKLCVTQRHSFHFEQVPFWSMHRLLSYQCAKNADRQTDSFSTLYSRLTFVHTLVQICVHSSLKSHIQAWSVQDTLHKDLSCKKVDILIFKNQALQNICLRHHVYETS